MNHMPNNKIEKEESSNSEKNVITPQMRILLDYLKEYQEINDSELQELLNIKKTRAYLLTRQMSEDGLIEITGRGSSKKYRLKQSDTDELI